MGLNGISRVHILGGAQTDFARNWSREGKGAVALLREVLDDGLTAAGVTDEDIRALNGAGRVACFVGNFCAEQYVRQGHLGALLTEASPLFYGVPAARYEAACASGSVALDAAMTKIRAGDADLCIVIGWELMKTVDSAVCGDILGFAALQEEESEGVPYPFPRLFGRLADELMRRYRLPEGIFLDDLARIAAGNYAAARSNPLAQTRKWFMDYGETRTRGTAGNGYVSGLLAVSDCSQITDGAALVVLASDAYVASHRLSAPVYVKGYGHRMAPLRFDAKMAESASSPFLLPWTRQAALDAYRRAGLDVSDVDVFEVHDCFTSSEYAALSALGLCAPGQEHDLIAGGCLAPDGTCPVNPSGGLIGCGHPVGATGVRMFLDIYRQVAGLAGGCQVARARNGNGMMLNIGGSATTNYTFIVGT